MNHFELWTIYDRPPGYPNTFVAIHSQLVEGVPRRTGDMMIGADLDVMREQLMKRGLVCLTRHPDDDPTIVEVWL